MCIGHLSLSSTVWTKEYRLTGTSSCFVSFKLIIFTKQNILQIDQFDYFAIKFSVLKRELQKQHQSYGPEIFVSYLFNN